MGFVDLLIVAVGLSMDAFAASICKGFQLKRPTIGQKLLIAFAFGAFQAIMPLIGWLLGVSFAQLIEPVDHWVAFALLAFLGGKMIWDARHDDDCACCAADAPKLRAGELLMLAVATSIDALAVGVSLAFLGSGIIVPALVIGLVTFAFSFCGVSAGSHVGPRFGSKATIVGGIVLIAIGLKILLEHLGVF